MEWITDVDDAAAIAYFEQRDRDTDMCAACFAPIKNGEYYTREGLVTVHINCTKELDTDSEHDVLSLNGY